MHLLDFMVNTGTAFGLGLAIGLERQFGQHPAGLRTNALVCFGAALFVSLGGLMIGMDNDPTARSRMASYVVSGIGFLGGGVILREGLTVKGMNTAATLWCTAAIGAICGAGHLWPATIASGVVLVLHLTMRPVAEYIDIRLKRAVNVETAYKLRVVCARDHEAKMRAVLMNYVHAHRFLHLQGLSIQDAEHADRATLAVDVHSHKRSDAALDELMTRLNAEPGVSSISWEKVR
jgi:putative Mg2+ transporter-C (MgtC) family protein